jgi:hypothetical protein
MKRTQLWPGVTLDNRTNQRVVIQWRTLPDGTRMALLMGEAPGSISGQELGIFSAIMSAAPAIFSMAKKVAPGLMSKAGELVSKVLPGPAANMLKSALAPAAAQAQQAIPKAGAARAAAPAAKVAPAAMMQQLMSQRRPLKAVRHITSNAPTPKGYTKVVPVMKIDEGAFLD